MRQAGHANGLDTDPGVAHGSFAEAIVNAAAEHEPSFVLVGQRSATVAPALGGPGEAVAASLASPVAIMIGETERIREVVLLDGQGSGEGQPYGAVGVAAELAARIGGKNVTTRPARDPTPFSKLAPGQLAIAPTSSWQAFAAGDPPTGAAVVMVLDPPQPPADADRSLFSIRDAHM